MLSPPSLRHNLIYPAHYILKCVLVPLNIIQCVILIFEEMLSVFQYFFQLNWKDVHDGYGQMLFDYNHDGPKEVAPSYKPAPPPSYKP